MGLFSWISTKKEERAALDITTATVASDGTEDSNAAAALLQAIIGTGAINADTAMEIPALSAAIDFVSGIVARLPVKLYREENDGSECRTNEITDDPRLRLLNEETGDLVGAYAARAAQISDMFRYGAGYVYINRNGTNVESLHYVKHTDVSVTKNADPIFKDAKLYVGGRQYDPWNFIILARKSTDGVRGVSIIDEHKTLLSSMYNTLKFENVSSKTGGNKKGFLQSEKNLSKDALAAVRKAWEELYANNGNNMMVLNNGLKYTPSASTAVEMQLNQNKLTNTSQLDLAFLLSPDVISGKVSRDQFSLAMTNAVMPIVTIYQEAINRSLLMESEKRTMYFALDVNELLKGDTLTRYQAYAVGLQNNFLQLDEVRYKEDLPATGFNYITLGLNNVLLDPKTNVIYTPNTNQMVKVGEMVKNTEENADEGLQDDGESGIIEERYSDSQPRDEHGRWRGRGSGHRGNSSAISNSFKITRHSSGRSSASKAADQRPDISATGENKFNTGFNQKTLDEHWSGGKSDHSSEYPGMTKQQYAERALQLVQSAVDGKSILGYKTATGTVVRYDVAANDFVKGHPDSGIATMFKPNLKSEYIHKQYVKDGGIK